MTSQIIKKMLKEFDLDTLDSFEYCLFQDFNGRLAKIPALLRIMQENNDLSENLQEIKDFINEYEITIKN